MGLTKYLQELHREKNKSYSMLIRNRLIEWRKEPYLKRIERPTNLASARRLGYKAKQGFILVRIRIPRGQKKKPRINKGRRSKHMRQRLSLQKNYRLISEERAIKRFPNLEVLNSYKAAKDGLHYWFEVILVDPNHPRIKSDKNISWISSSKHRGRVFRGLTSASKRSRGLRGKGKGYEKTRPSKSANKKRRNK